MGVFHVAGVAAGDYLGTMKNIAPLLFILMLLAGCKTLESVNSFSNAAKASVENYGSIKATAVGEYVAFTRILYYNKFSSPDLTLTYTTPDSLRRHLTMAIARWQDTTLKKTNQALDDYFAGLAALSADSLVKFDLDTLAGPLTGGSIIDTTKISTSTVTAITGIAGKIGAAILEGYRVRHVKKYVAEANALVEKIAGDLTDAFSGLDLELNERAQMLLDTVYKPLLRQAPTPMERKQVVDEYYRAIEAIHYDRRQIAIYVQCLGVIAAAHNYIAQNVDRLKTKEVRKALAKYAGQLKSLNTEFSKLQN